MTGNRRPPSHPDLRSDNLRPSSLRESGFAWGDTPGHMARMVRDVMDTSRSCGKSETVEKMAQAMEAEGLRVYRASEVAERRAYRDYWCRAREEMRLHLADLTAKTRQYPPVVEEW